MPRIKLNLHKKQGHPQLGSQQLATQAFVNYARNRVLKQDLNFLILVIGGTGSGKSETCIHLSYLIQGFTYTGSQVVSSVKELIDMTKRNPPKGNCYIYEEAGVTLHNLRFWSNANKAFNYLVQTFRDQNLVLFINAPDPRLVDSQSKRMFHCVLTCKGVKRSRITGKKYCAVKVEFPNVSMYYKDRIFYNKLNAVINQEVLEVSELRLPKAPVHLIDEYKRKKSMYNFKLQQRLSKMLVDEY